MDTGMSSTTYTPVLVVAPSTSLNHYALQVRHLSKPPCPTRLPRPSRSSQTRTPGQLLMAPFRVKLQHHPQHVFLVAQKGCTNFEI
jgi:hypothetical protein